MHEYCHLELSPPKLGVGEARFEMPRKAVGATQVAQGSAVMVEMAPVLTLQEDRRKVARVALEGPCPLVAGQG